MTEDGHCKWQALEGLAAVAYNEEKVELSLDYIQECLRALSSSGDDDMQVQRRLVAKLSDLVGRSQVSQLGQGPLPAARKQLQVIQRASTTTTIFFFESY